MFTNKNLLHPIGPCMTKRLHLQNMQGAIFNDIKTSAYIYIINSKNKYYILEINFSTEQFLSIELYLIHSINLNALGFSVQ